MAVVAIAEAARVGRVEDVLLDTAPFEPRDCDWRPRRARGVIGLGEIEMLAQDAIATADIEAARTSDAILTDDGFMALDALSTQVGARGRQHDSR